MIILDLKRSYQVNKIFFPKIDFYSTLVSITQKFETTFKVWLGPLLFLMVRDADDLKTILSSEECFDKMGIIYKRYFSYGLFVLEGDEYKSHRKAINPLFTPAALKSYLPTVNKKVEDFIFRFDRSFDPKEEIEFARLATDFSFDSSLEIFFGIGHVDQDKRLKIVEAVEQ